MHEHTSVLLSDGARRGEVACSIHKITVSAEDNPCSDLFGEPIAARAEIKSFVVGRIGETRITAPYRWA
jgi:hypothetical protein